MSKICLSVDGDVFAGDEKPVLIEAELDSGVRIALSNGDITVINNTPDIAVIEGNTLKTFTQGTASFLIRGTLYGKTVESSFEVEVLDVAPQLRHEKACKNKLTE